MNTIKEDNRDIRRKLGEHLAGLEDESQSIVWDLIKDLEDEAMVDGAKKLTEIRRKLEYTREDYDFLLKL